jgi:hypothetical protein
MVSESQRGDSEVDLSLSLMKTVRTLAKSQRGLKGQQAGRPAQKALDLLAVYPPCT